MDKERDIADSNNQVARAQVDVLNIKVVIVEVKVAGGVVMVVGT